MKHDSEASSRATQRRPSTVLVIAAVAALMALPPLGLAYEPGPAAPLPPEPGNAALTLTAPRDVGVAQVLATAFGIGDQGLALVEAGLGHELAQYVAYLVLVQSVVPEPLERGRLIREVLPSFQAALQAAAPTFVADDSLCPPEVSHPLNKDQAAGNAYDTVVRPFIRDTPPPPANGIDLSSDLLLPGQYGAGGVCITGTDSRSYDTAYDASFGFNGLFIDLGGDDTYSAGGKSFGSRSALAPPAVTGAFFDLGGDDQYSVPNPTDQWSFGYTGLFFDAAGNDRYSMTAGNGFGVIGGSFIEAGGSDVYVSGGQSFAGSLSLPGGAGLFLEVSGDDDYSAGAESFGWNGGAFLDLAGDDDYASTGYGLAFGGGDVEAPSSPCLPTNPFCPPLSFSLIGDPPSVFLDAAGNDAYFASGSGVYGYGGWFIDLAGVDEYVHSGPATDDGFGSGRLLGVTGAFIDYAGLDTYDADNVNSNGAFGRSNGFFFDGEGSDGPNGDIRAKQNLSFTHKSPFEHEA